MGQTMGLSIWNYLKDIADARGLISTKSVVASSAHRMACTGFAALFESGLNLGHGGIVRHARQ